ncbi:hypothetical protein CGI59_21750 [Vibrio parahaemolyticus]|nr:hypothetical protein CGI59_21750 [Vibrio parahaemolyticus]
MNRPSRRGEHTQYQPQAKCSSQYHQFIKVHLTFSFSKQKIRADWCSSRQGASPINTSSPLTLGSLRTGGVKQEVIR